MEKRSSRAGGVLPCALIAAISAASARADFTVSYDQTTRHISVVDNANGTVVISSSPQLYIGVYPNPLQGETFLTPAVSWAPHGPDASHADGMDLTFTFDNTSDFPARPSQIRIPGITFGLPSDQLSWVRTRDFRTAGMAFDITSHADGTNTDQQLKYPGETFSPVAYLSRGGYALGISVLYPVLDPNSTTGAIGPNHYAHRIGMGVGLPNAQGGLRAWWVNIALCAQDITGLAQTPDEGLIPPHQQHSYTVCVRVMNTAVVQQSVQGQMLPENQPPASTGLQTWLRLFAPYRDYFTARYGGVLYKPDHRPVLGCTTSQVSLVSAQNPYGFSSSPLGNGRPYPDGWAQWRQYLLNKHAQGWNRYMIWTPSGVYGGVGTMYNYPYQFTSQWASQLVPSAPPSLLRDLSTGADSQLGLWWGNSKTMMTTWPPTASNPPQLVDPDSPAHRASAHTELSGAVETAGAAMIGLDAFAPLVAWKAHRWIRMMQGWYPGVRFAQESDPGDIMSTLSPGVMTATLPEVSTDFRLQTPYYLRELLLPGHGTWAVITLDLALEIGHVPTSDDIRAKALAMAQLGYVPVTYDILLPPDGLGAVPTIAAPCDVMTPTILHHPPATVRTASGQSVTIAGQPSNPGSTSVRWQVKVPGGVWVLLFETPGLVSGTETDVLTLQDVRMSASGNAYRLAALGPCTIAYSSETTLTVCGSADFNHDGDIGTDADIEAFFACLANNCCATCDGRDFNGDGDAATDADIEAFFSALAGRGSC